MPCSPHSNRHCSWLDNLIQSSELQTLTETNSRLLWIVSFENGTQSLILILTLCLYMCDNSTRESAQRTRTATMKRISSERDTAKSTKEGACTRRRKHLDQGACSTPQGEAYNRCVAY